MKAALIALIPLLCALAAPATAQRRSVGGGWVNPPAGGGVHGHRGFAVPFFYPEREVVVVEREVIREVPAAPAPAPSKRCCNAWRNSCPARSGIRLT